MRGVQACRHPFDVAIRDACLVQSPVFIKMNKRPRDLQIQQQEGYALELAQRGEFVQLAGLLQCITISDDVVRKLIDICNAHVSRVNEGLDRAQAEFISKMNKM